MHAGALGDFVLTLHLVTTLRRQFPRAQVHVVARCGLAAWAVEHDVIHAAFDPDSVSLRDVYRHPPSLDGPFARFVGEYDWVISFLGGPRSPVSHNLALLHRGHTIGLRPQPADETLARRIHVTRQWCDSARQAGVELGDLVPVEFGDPAPPDRLRDILVHPGSGGDRKCCPVAVLECLVRLIVERGHPVRWMVGPVEMERHSSEELDAWARLAPVVHEPSLVKAADRVQRATDFVGNDAGMTHVAAACGLRTVALYGPTDPAVWCPLGAHVHPVRFHFHQARAEPPLHARMIVDALGL